jgi:hypothetical protein
MLANACRLTSAPVRGSAPNAQHRLASSELSSFSFGERVKNAICRAAVIRQSRVPSNIRDRAWCSVQVARDLTV